jgi:WD40 repeat protein
VDRLLLAEITVADSAEHPASPTWSYRAVREFAWDGGRVISLSLDPAGQPLLTNGADGTDGRVRLWDVNTGKLIRAFETPQPPQFWWFDVRFLPDGKRFVTTGIPGGFAPTGLALWDIDSGKVLHTFVGHTDAVIAVAVAPDGLQAVSGGHDGTVRLWSLTRDNPAIYKKGP